MSSPIWFDDRHLELSNRHFSNLMEFAIAAVDKVNLSDVDLREVERLEDEIESEAFWPGRGLTVEEDLPELSQKKLWARLFADCARAIAQAMQASDLLVYAVHQQEAGWYPDTQDRAEFADRTAKGAW